MNKNLLILSVIIVIALGGYFLLQGKFSFTPAPSPTGVPQQQQTSLPPSGEEQEGLAQAQEFTVIGTEFAFSPRELRVKAGQPVRIIFINRGSVAHNFVIPDLGVGTKITGPGEQDTIQFSVAEKGTFLMTSVCTIPGHKEAGMTGVVRVE